MNKNITYVTGMWDIKRGDISDSFKRPYQEYLNKFKDLLKTDCNLYIFCSKDDNDLVWEYRSKENTVIKNIELHELWKWFEFSEKVDKIRTNKDWYSYAGWLEDSPQSKLAFYNPIVMSKMFFLNDVSIFNPFDSEYFFWIDGGLTNTVSSGYFTNDMVLDYIDRYYDIEDKFIFLSFPYDGDLEIHGFEKKAINRYSNTKNVNYVCRGGFFGGKREHLNSISTIYYSLLSLTLDDGYMGTEESVFTIITHLYPEQTHRFEIEGNGLVYSFFEHVKNTKNKPIIRKNNKKAFRDLKVNLYVISYNSPEQFEELCKSIIGADDKSFQNYNKILLNNSLKRDTDQKYKELCKKYNFFEIKKENIGICGGRQFIAEHFYQSDSDYMIFFEDDMFMNQKDEGYCVNNFRHYTDSLLNKSLHVIHDNDFDFLKLQYTELYGDNTTQWAWYNLPQDKREEYFPDKTKLPVASIDINAPKTIFKNIGKYKDIGFINGDVYYCNWPHFIGKEGTKKIFINVKYQYPYEQTWMSLVFQLQKEEKINSAVLLFSPINHSRFVHYEKNERREN